MDCHREVHLVQTTDPGLPVGRRGTPRLPSSFLLSLSFSPPSMPRPPAALTVQVFFQVGQSVVLGYLTDYFTIIEPTEQDTRNAYLLALGEFIIICMASVYILEVDCTLYFNTFPQITQK